MIADPRVLLRGLVFCCCILLLPLRKASGVETECWTHFFGGPGSIITDLLSTREGIWATGRITEDGSTPDLWIALFALNGQVQWQQRLPILPWAVTLSPKPPTMVTMFLDLRL